MEPTTIDQKRQGMEAFLSDLQAREEQEMLMQQYKNSPKYKLNVLNEEREKGLENCAAGVICKIYRDALPLDDEYKAANQGELDDGFMDTIKKKSPDGAYTFLSSCASAGCKPAKLMLEAVTEAIDASCSKFYENLDEVDPDEIDMGPSSKIVNDAVDKVTAKMDYDQISEIIEQNVQNTVKREIETQKAEDEKLQELQSKLAEDDSVQTESAIDAALMREGMSRKQYQPTLFNGIMIGKVKEFTESGDLDTEHVQKKAFFESVKEYTKIETLSMLNMVKFNQSDLDRLATEYAAGMNQENKKIKRGV